MRRSQAPASDDGGTGMESASLPNQLERPDKQRTTKGWPRAFARVAPCFRASRVALCFAVLPLAVGPHANCQASQNKGWPRLHTQVAGPNKGWPQVEQTRGGPRSRGRHGSTRWFLIIPEVASGGFDGGDGIFTRNPPSKAASGVEWSVNYWTGRRISTQSAWAPSERHLHSTSGALSCGIHVRLRIHYVARHSVERLQDLVVVDVDARTKGTGPN